MAPFNSNSYHVVSWANEIGPLLRPPRQYVLIPENWLDFLTLLEGCTWLYPEEKELCWPGELLPQTSCRAPSQRVRDSMTDACLQCKQPGLCVQCTQSLEIRTVNLWLFVFLCSLCSVSLCAVQFCTCTVKEVNTKAYRNWTSWCTIILIYMFVTINCAPWMQEQHWHSLTFSVSSPRREQRFQIGEVWLILTAINFLASTFINMTKQLKPSLKSNQDY